ncbi:uncharacterized protein LOC111072524 [Drosophila obscura]|uniref:uncharacterized protein LOC111072524 n=1 Tax=Drosophila obscura TaxID=7282 RepID=UPI000BA14937|nr:uncharacterized protein LOC111072524 [Drosophila obscura]XP_041448242.1 uncharacterized protein LOC111072524 [Drosophila obscura]
MCIQNCDNIKICDTNGSDHDAQDKVAVVEGGENNVIHTSDLQYENFKLKLQLQSELNRKRQKPVKGHKLSNFKILMCCCYFIIIVLMI